MGHWVVRTAMKSSVRKHDQDTKYIVHIGVISIPHSPFQMKLYQLSRLLYEINPNLYYLLKENEVTPFFYAAPWFLTLFASQFPIAFCARVLGTVNLCPPPTHIVLCTHTLQSPYLYMC